MNKLSAILVGASFPVVLVDPLLSGIVFSTGVLAYFINREDVEHGSEDRQAKERPAIAGAYDLSGAPGYMGRHSGGDNGPRHAADYSRAGALDGARARRTIGYVTICAGDFNGVWYTWSVINGNPNKKMAHSSQKDALKCFDDLVEITLLVVNSDDKMENGV